MTITKRIFCCILVLALTATVFAGGQREAADPTEPQRMNLRWSGMMSPTHAWVITAQDLAREVAERTDGRITIQFYPAGALGTQADGIEMLGTGDLAFLTSGPTIFSSYVPQAQLFMLPYVFDDLDHVRRVVQAPFIEEMFNEEILEKTGVRTLAWWYYGDRHLTTRNTPARTPEDVTPLKIRSVDNPVAQNVVLGLGGNPVPIAFDELYFALQTGVADGQENPVTTIYDRKFFEVQNYMIETRHNVHMGTVHVSERVWQSLSQEDRDMFVELFDKYTVQVDQLIEELTEQNLSDMKAAGLQVIEPDREAFRHHATSHINRVYGGDPQWSEILQQIEALR